MKLSIDALTEAGAFTGQPVERQVMWKQGGEDVTATVYVRPLSYASAVADLRALNENADAIAERIAYSIVDDKGAPVFTAADITGEATPERGPLSASLTVALLQVIGEVNGLGKADSQS